MTLPKLKRNDRTRRWH